MSPIVYAICADGNVITFNSVKVEGKKEVSTLDWINGYQVKSKETKFEEWTMFMELVLSESQKYVA